MVLSSAHGAVPTPDQAWRPDAVGGYASTRIIVRFTPGMIDAPLGKEVRSYKASGFEARAVLLKAPPARANAALTAEWHRWDVAGMRPVYPHPFGDPDVAAHYGLDRTFVLEVPAGTDTPAMAAAFAALDDQIEVVELDGIGTVAELIPNDSGFWRQYGMHNTGQPSYPGQPGGLDDADIDAPEAWELHTGDVGTVTVAIVDTGVTPHTEFQDRMVAGINTTNNSAVGTVDGCPHGTHVAGIVAATGNNAVGVAGVTWGASIMPVRVFDGCSGNETDTSEGIIWAVDNYANVINISLQFYSGGPTFKDAINYAYDHGVLVVSVAGNDRGAVVAYPGRFDKCMAVSATTDDDELATLSNTGLWSSNYGDEIDVCAPGNKIWSTWTTNYLYLSGTSMAAPHVTGLAALLKSYVPQLTHDEIWTIICETADDLGPEGWDDYYGHGRINAYQALLAAGPNRIIASYPPDGAIDARQPSELDGSNPTGWQSIDLTFAGDLSLLPGLVADDFAVTQEGGVEPVPTVVEVLPVEGEDRVVRVTLDRAISVRAWTTITHTESDTSVCLGYLPGDVNADQTSVPADILRVIDALNGIIDLPIWSTDVDRSGEAGPPDILREIDLLNGADAYDTFLGATLP